MKYAYYPGCSLHATAAEFDASTRVVCNKLGVELVEIPDWNCCGASSAHNDSHFLAAAVPGRNILLAEDLGLDVAAPCAACYQRLVLANKELKQDSQLRDAMKEATGRDFKGVVDVKTIVEAIAENFDAAKVVKPLQGLKVVNYYGCLMVKPPKAVHADDPENPMLMDKLMDDVGAESIQWPFKTECCGGSMPFYNEEPVLKLLKDILKIAKDSGAQAIVTACPLCMSNLDMRQSSVESKYKVKYNIPVIYFTQLMGLALGATPAEMGLNSKHFRDPMPLLTSLGLA